ncbi:DDE-type integrase/transposase/recombinase [Streptomyces mirabilis]|uniref:DDE-type integrase/transposase/recombinase n=2 Tax=Streptomyces TaxID=1883 RepID=UPI002256FF00|nr:DDE-type integrase/transposase/recombinase [Streptomyces mirabilis]MCX5356375.1 DDE-type integrase/transposase/recombinase [Streptomyces mirabilis]
MTAACRLTGRSRATHYRRLQPPPPRKPRLAQVQPSALAAEERTAVLELMNSDTYAELPPAQIWARELDAGRYHCSVSTMCRILREKGQTGERRRQATHPAKTVPELVATAPSQVFTWDITKAAGPVKGIWYHAYVIIDIFSRYIVGHTVEAAESAARAEELIREAITRNGIVPETAHADRGTSMTSKKVSQLLIDLGVARSHSRPKVSNDNPYSEAQFKTTKCMSDYPERFDSLAHAREWFDAFIAYYNHEHRHSGIGWHTSASVHFGTAEEVRDQRAVTLAEAYARHPERFGRRPRPPEIPQKAWINNPAKRREPAPQTSQRHDRLTGLEIFRLRGRATSLSSPGHCRPGIPPPRMPADSPPRSGASCGTNTEVIAALGERLGCLAGDLRLQRPS